METVEYSSFGESFQFYGAHCLALFSFNEYGFCGSAALAAMYLDQAMKILQSHTSENPIVQKRKDDLLLDAMMQDECTYLFEFQKKQRASSTVSKYRKCGMDFEADVLYTLSRAHLVFSQCSRSPDSLFSFRGFCSFESNFYC